jgi:hypothetical protein
MLSARLDQIAVLYPPTAVYFDERITTNVTGAKSREHDRLQAVVEDWCARRGIRAEAVRRGYYLKAFSGCGVRRADDMEREALRRGFEVTAPEALDALAIFVHAIGNDTDALALRSTRELPGESRAESAAFVRQLVIKHRIQNKPLSPGFKSFRDDPEGAMFSATLRHRAER